jgi:hypothetical protein
MNNTSIVTFDSRARQRLAHLLRETVLHATDQEAQAIHAVHDAVRAGELTIRDAHAALVALRAQQRAA